MKRLLLMCLILFVSIANAEIHPIYRQLKSFRTYLSLSNLTEEKHQFRAWFHDVEPMVCSLAGNTPDEIAALKGCIYGGLVPQPPLKSRTPTPPILKKLEAAVKDRITAQYPELSELVIEYTGSFRTIYLREVIPTIDGVNVAVFPVKVDMKKHTLEPSGLSIVGSSSICSSSEACENSPEFVDFTPPASEEGTLISARYFKNKLPETVADSFVNAIFATVEAKDKGIYKNPIESILARQGTTELPPGLNQRLNFSLQLYGRTADFDKQVSVPMTLTFMSKELLSGFPVTVSQTIPELGDFKVIANANLDSHLLTVQMIAPTGEEKTAEFALNPTIVGSGTEQALALPIALVGIGKAKDEFKGYDFKGYGSFQSVDAHPKASLTYDFMKN